MKAEVRVPVRLRIDDWYRRESDKMQALDDELVAQFESARDGAFLFGRRPESPESE